MVCKGCVYHEIIEQICGFDMMTLQGLGYESGGYVPFLTESLSIHAQAASLISSDAGSDAIKLTLHLVMTREEKESTLKSLLNWRSSDVVGEG